MEHHHCFIIKVKYQASAGESDVNEVGKKKPSHSPAATQHLNESSEREREQGCRRGKRNPALLSSPHAEKCTSPKPRFSRSGRSGSARSFSSVNSFTVTNKIKFKLASIKLLLFWSQLCCSLFLHRKLKNFLFHILFVIAPHFNVIHCNEF